MGTALPGAAGEFVDVALVHFQEPVVLLGLFERLRVFTLSVLDGAE